MGEERLDYYTHQGKFTYRNGELISKEIHQRIPEGEIVYPNQQQLQEKLDKIKLWKSKP